MIPKLINLHERLSHFYNDRKVNADGDLLNEREEDVLSALGFTSYLYLLTWLKSELLSRNLDWKSINAGSPHVAAFSNVLHLAEQKTGIIVIDEIINEWDKIKNLGRFFAIVNYSRLYNLPRAKWQRKEDKRFSELMELGMNKR